MRLVDVKPGSVFRLADSNTLVGSASFIKIDRGWHDTWTANAITVDGFAQVRLHAEVEVTVIGKIEIQEREV